MRLRIGQFENPDDFDEVDDFTYARSRALQKLRDGHRRDERTRHLDRQWSRFKGRRDHVDWNWDEYADYEDSNLRY
jgi:hypothetical protein